MGNIHVIQVNKKQDHWQIEYNLYKRQSLAINAESICSICVLSVAPALLISPETVTKYRYDSWMITDE